MPRSSLIWTAGITMLAASSLAADYQQALILNDREDRARSRVHELDNPFIERSKLPHKISVEAPRPPEFSS